MDRADVIVIGAGVMGASIAFQLSRLSEKRVVIVDQAAPLGGMSGRTFGQVRLHYSNALLLEMALRGYACFRDWPGHVGYGASGYVAMGYMLLVVEDQLEPLHRNIELAQSLGIDTRFIGPDDIKAIEPAVNTEGLVGGAYDPGGGYIDVTRIVLSWLGAAQERGVKLMCGCRVQNIETAGGRVSGVATTAGRIAAPVIVNAAGPWAAGLLSPLGVDAPIEARRLDTMYMRQPAGGAQIGCCITDGNSNVVIRPDMGRDFLAAAYPPEMEPVDDPLVSSTPQHEAAHVGRIRKALAERIPGLVDAEPVRAVCGSYDVTPDWHPIIGPVPDVEGLFLVAGFSGHGLKLSPAVGEVVAAMVLDRQPAFDMRPLRLGRFADGEPMFLAYGPGGRA